MANHELVHAWTGEREKTLLFLIGYWSAHRCLGRRKRLISLRIRKIKVSRDKSVTLGAAKGLGEHLVRDSVQCFVELLVSAASPR